MVTADSAVVATAARENWRGVILISGIDTWPARPFRIRGAGSTSKTGAHNWRRSRLGIQAFNLNSGGHAWLCRLSGRKPYGILLSTFAYDACVMWAIVPICCP